MKKVRHTAAVGLAALIACTAWGGVALGGDKRRERAARELREGEFASAEKIYRELIEKDAKDVEARLGLSFALLKQRRLRDAYDQAARVVAVEPLSARAHALLGAALLSAGNFDVSVEEFRTALSFKEDEALAVAGLALIDYYENRAAASLGGLRRAVQLDPGEPDYLFSYAQAAARTERYREAADAYEQFLRIAPKTDADRRARIRGLIDFLRYLGAQRPLYETAGAQRTVVPVELANSRPVIKVRVNGEKTPLRFVLDTGSGMCVISNDAAQRLGVRAVARGGMARAVGGGGRFEIIYGFLSSLQLGEARVENVPVYIRQFHNKQEPVDGYVGLAVLAKYLASVDYGRRELMLARGDEARALQAAQAVRPEAAAAPAEGLPRPAFFELPIRATSSGFWSSAVKIDGVDAPLNFIVDTGASISVVAAELFEREEMSRFEQKSRLRIYGAAGVTEDVPLLLLPQINIGGAYNHANLPAAVLDMAPINETAGFEQAGIIGGNVLRHFRVTFDFQRGVVRLDPLPGARPAQPPDKEVVITPEAMSGE